jgi:hypothetical protein
MILMEPRIESGQAADDADWADKKRIRKELRLKETRCKTKY